MAVSIAPCRPALRYHGGKWNLAPWIIGHFPKHHHYVEPYGGSAAVLLQKEPSPLETYNDLDDRCVTFFQVLRERPDELVRSIELTPWSRLELSLSRESCDDPLEKARRFFVRSWQSIGGPTGSYKHGWRYDRRPGSWKTAVETWGLLDHLHVVADRMRRVQIEASDALDVIRRFDTPRTLYYLDPPYVFSTRSGKWAAKAYRFEMDDAAHEQLAGVLNGVQGFVVLSGYPSEMYDRLYEGWYRAETTARTNSRHMVRTECLWLSPRTVEALKAEHWQGVLEL